MKTKLIFLALLLVTCFNYLQAQEQKELVNKIPLYNLFYLSKYLDNDYLSIEQKNAVNAQFINLLGIDNLKLLEKQDLSEFPKLKHHLYKIKNTPPSEEEFISNLINRKWFNFKIRFLPINNEIETLNKIVKNSDQIETLKQKQTSANNKFKVSEKVMQDKIKTTTDTININELRSQLVKERSRFEDSIKIFHDDIDAKTLSLTKEINLFSSEYFSNTERTATYKTATINISNFYTEKSLAETLQFTNNYVKSIQSQGTSSFKVPSEAQLIDAMALFLANRAKQEAAIWFMDQLRTRLKNPLVKDAFPQTIKLITSLEDYKVPNFGTEWRYAVSSDFIMMPEKIVDSEWMDVMVHKDSALTNIKTAIRFGSKLNRLMAENYNYRDIIQTLYLDKLASENPNVNSQSIQGNLDNSITLLYLMTNELYSIDHLGSTPTYRLLNFEELNSLNQNQWEYLIELLYLKYFYDQKHTFTKQKQWATTFENTKIAKQGTNVYLSKVLLSLSQFDKIRRDLEKSNADEKQDFSKQNYNNAWKLINQILTNLNNTTAINIPISTIHLDKLQKSIAIYENIQGRNFRAAVQNTLSLINDYNTQNVNSKDNKVYSFTINNQNLLIQKINDDSINLRIINPKKESIKMDPLSRFNINLKYDNPSQKKLNVFSTEHPDKKFLSEVIIKGDYSKLLKKLNLTSSELLRYISAVQTQDPSIKQNSVPIEEQELIKYQAPLNEKYTAQLLKLASFFGDVLSASNSDQIADVITSHALPPTSYKLKRKVKSSIDFNAYVGAYAGYKLASSNSTYINGWTGGIAAPIGLTYTKSFGNNGNGTFGLSFNFLDLGNIVNHYLTSSEKYYKDVHFSEVFSPNINILYSIKNTPLVAFIGGSFLPMKNINVDGSIKNNRAFDVSIIQAGLKIDIPLINLWTNQKE